MSICSEINLSPDLTQGTPGIDCTSLVFSGGEVHVKIKDLYGLMIRINSRCNNSDDFMRIAMTVDALRGMSVRHIELFMPYLPYARQDRRTVYGEPFSLRIFGDLLNTLKLDRIYTYDVHSDVAAGIIDNLVCIDNHKEVGKFTLALTKDYVMVCLDGGAYKKIYKLASAIGYQGEIVIANKVRDVRTGKILRTDVCGPVAGKNCLIVDDICDGGATFVGLAKKLKEYGAGDLYLFVSHGIFSKGTKELLSLYKEIATTNSIREWTEGVITYKLHY